MMKKVVLASFIFTSILLAGCLATSTIVGVSEPDLTKIHSNDQRSQVEKELGKRLWRLGVAEGLTYDIYQYRTEVPARPFMGPFVMGVDYITLGTFEYIGAQAMQFIPVKQVAIAYDNQDRVRFISQPWLVNTFGPCRRMRSLLPVDSGVPSAVHPSPLNHPATSASDVAFLELDGEIDLVIDGRKLEGDIVELPPGYYTFYGYFNDIEFLPGRLYQWKHEIFRRGRQFADVSWVEDFESAEVIGCAWPSNLLGSDYRYLTP